LILVDTNILIDIFAEDPIWKDRSLVALRLAKARDALSVNEVVYAELAPGFPNVLELDLALDALAVAGEGLKALAQAIDLLSHAQRQLLAQRRARGRLAQREGLVRAAREPLARVCVGELQAPRRAVDAQRERSRA